MKKKRAYEPPEVIEFPSLADDEVTYAKRRKCRAGGTPSGGGKCKAGSSTGGRRGCRAGGVAGRDCRSGGTAQKNCRSGSSTGKKCKAGGMQKVL